MKVLCIKEGKWESRTGVDMLGPEYMEEVTASQCPIYSHSYDIAEYPFNKSGRPQSFTKKHFIPLSDLDETQMERNYKTETA